MKIAVLGTGCPKCIKTEEVVRKVVADNKVDAEVIKVKEISEIMKYNVMMTPAVAVDGKVVVSGKIPSEAEIKKALGL
ncbi:MAG: thioredoxin family protein [Candidatus Goldiibacteriota bacterium HGW-Goldbacteria-1]|jgi:small redox-active disulfide protein 2|nr:MAG: thioredoxin family protein [Candidatus Goldiibacteriota bacterium HGW-Goldbacteria-1]